MGESHDAAAVPGIPGNTVKMDMATAQSNGKKYYSFLLVSKCRERLCAACMVCYTPAAVGSLVA